MSGRYLSEAIRNHLKTLRQMVFLVGPRQVGKTTLAQSMLLKSMPGVNYFNWDVAEHRKILSLKIFPGRESLQGEGREVIVFDEIHKYSRWKNALKGLFDIQEPQTHWIITGSALLNVWRKGQDSLMGRHFTYHLAPFSVAEYLKQDSASAKLLPDLVAHPFSSPDSETQEALSRLMRFGGFPEPLFRAEDSFLSQWRSGRLDRLVNQDLATTEMLRQLPLVEQLMFLLPERVGSLLSLNSLREDLEVHFATVRHWMELLERVFYGFFVRPYAKHAARMLRKEAKWYLWDWSEIESEGHRFENLAAVHLLKYIHFINDLGLDELSLHYVRNKEKQEVDFLICRRKKPFLLVECKLDDTNLSPALARFSKVLGVKHAIQLVGNSTTPRVFHDGDVTLQVVPAGSFFRELV